jgi:hypothetical protein
MTYQTGDRVALVHTGDPHTRLIPGTAGTVTGYDDRHGQLNVAWDDGSSLSMLLRDGDQVRLLDPPVNPKPESLRSGHGQPPPRHPARRRPTLHGRKRHDQARQPRLARRGLAARHHRSRHWRQQATVGTLLHLHPAAR